MVDKSSRTDADLTATLATRGIDDQPVKDARTMTIRVDPTLQNWTPEELVNRLPHLMDSGEGRTDLRVASELGRGGMGVVEAAEQVSVGRQVAMKRVRSDKKSGEATLRLLREGWTTGRLEHPNIVPIYTLGRDDREQPAIVMKKISGTPWSDIIADPDRAPQAFDAEDPLELHIDVLVQVCHAVAYAHSQGIIHRDLKPENVMLGEFGEVYLVDWGIAVALEEPADKRVAWVGDARTTAGTPGYMAPEMVDGEPQDLGEHTDIFLLGAMLYEALTGNPPYDGATVYQILIDAHTCRGPEFDDSVPPELARSCQKAMARQPDARFESTSSLREALQRYRRLRQARRLTERGEAALEGLDQMIDDEMREQTVEPSAIQSSFDESRFAFEQALEIDAGNPRTVAGLQQVLETMAERALRKEAPRAAERLLAELPEPRPDLEKRLDRLKDHVESRKQEYQELRQIRHDLDPDVGRRWRTVAAAVLGVFLTGIATAAVSLFDAAVLAPTYSTINTYLIIIMGFAGGVFYLGRNKLFSNLVNRQILLGFIVIFTAALSQHIGAWNAGMEPRSALTLSWMIFVVGTFLQGILFDRRILGAALPFLVVAITGAFSLEWQLRLTPVANAMALGVVAWIWWPEKEASSSSTPVG